MKRDRTEDFFVCRHCGAEVPMGALACRECGSDEETGWSESEEEYAEDEEFDYEEYLRREHPEQAPVSAGRVLARLALVVLVLALVLALLWW